jgi:hypothetical protein
MWSRRKINASSHVHGNEAETPWTMAAIIWNETSKIIYYVCSAIIWIKTSKIINNVCSAMYWIEEMKDYLHFLFVNVN